jgi:hypothetical protein
MYRQILSYLEEVIRDQRDPPKSQLHFGEVVNRDLPQWASAFNPEVSCIGDGEMARINIEASAALSDWIDLQRADQQHFRRPVKAAVQLLPFPIAQLDGSTYYQRFRALDAFNSAPDGGPRARFRPSQPRPGQRHPQRSLAQRLGH